MLRHVTKGAKFLDKNGLSNDDGDGNESGKKAMVYMSKTILYHRKLTRISKIPINFSRVNFRKRQFPRR